MARVYKPKGTYQVTTHVAVVLLVLVIFVSVGYFFFLGKPNEEAKRLELGEELSTKRQLWDSRRPTSFQYVVERDCDCVNEDERPFSVTDREGQRSARFPIPVESSTGELISVPPNPIWIEGVFALIDETLQVGGIAKVRYDSLYGYPETAEIRRDGDRKMIIERYEIRDFEVLERRQEEQ